MIRKIKKEWIDWAKKKAVEDMEWFDKEIIKNIPNKLKFLKKLRKREKIIFYRAWWMGFFQGQDFAEEFK